MSADAGTGMKVSASRASRFAQALFVAAGVEPDAAQRAAAGLVHADLQGVGSHGLLQAPNYLKRLMAGTITGRGRMQTVHRSGAVSVFDAGLALGHAVARQAMDAAMESARTHGIGAAAVRCATHFGVAGDHAALAADAGMIGIVMCNTRPMMPAPGGDASVVGNNPLAVAVPAEGRPPIVFDMAMSTAAMGRIRLAAQAGEDIPPGWAFDAGGEPTTDAGAALAGMLAPAAGAKGFGLALMVDFLCALSGGSAGPELGSMHGDPRMPADCSWLFLALDPSHFGMGGAYGSRVAELAGRIGSLPGDRKLAAMREADGHVVLPRGLIGELAALAAELGVPPLSEI